LAQNSLFELTLYVRILVINASFGGASSPRVDVLFGLVGFYLLSLRTGRVFSRVLFLRSNAVKVAYAPPEPLIAGYFFSLYDFHYLFGASRDFFRPLALLFPLLKDSTKPSLQLHF